MPESATSSAMDVTPRSTLELLRAYGAILDELRRRDVVRSANSPISDLAEVLFCRAFGWTRAGGSAAGYDATDAAGVRYQIKARRLTRGAGGRQLSAIRNLDREPFDHLAAVLFDADFTVYRAALIPLSVVKKRVRHSVHTNSHVLNLRDDVWLESGVADVTEAICVVANALQASA